MADPSTGVAPPPADAATAEPLDHQDFATVMAAFAPFEAAPVIAVAVSGGRDSLALALLADQWARAQGGHAIALTVDHRLRPEASAEAAQVGKWLDQHGITHHCLTWSGPSPTSGIQAAARNARYALLENWCHEHGILHLLLGHQQDDQAETFLLRLGRGSGVYGLAAMSAVVERPAVRLLRPLLGIPRDHLAATLSARNQPWLDDPSNRDPRHARVALRQALHRLGEQAPNRHTLAAAARRLGQGRANLEQAVDRVLVEAVEIDPAGYALCIPETLCSERAEVGLRALARLLATVGGGSYAPALEPLQRLYDQMVETKSATTATLANCRLCRFDSQRLLICREARNLPAPCTVHAGQSLMWDRRYHLTVGAAGDRLTLAPLGTVSAKALQDTLPRPTWPTLPALWDKTQNLVAVPYAEETLQIRFRPASPLSGPGFVTL